MRFAFNILDNFDQFLDNLDKTSMFEAFAKKLSIKQHITRQRELLDGIYDTVTFRCSVRDILENVALLESFKLSDPKPTVERFLGFRHKYFAGDSNSLYRNVFDFLSQRIGSKGAYSLLSPLSFIALQGDNPPESFGTIVDIIEDLLADGMSLQQLESADMPKMFSLLEMGDIHNLWIYNLDSVSDKVKETTPFQCAKYAVNLLGASKLIEISARPSFINSLARDTVKCLVPLVTVFSSAAGSDLKGLVRGIAAEDEELKYLIVGRVGLVGAAERLTLYREQKDLHQFCPHYNSCPHYKSGLCFNYFTPPSIELGYDKCGFIEAFESRTKLKPIDAWIQLKKKIQLD